MTGFQAPQPRGRSDRRDAGRPRGKVVLLGLHAQMVELDPDAHGSVQGNQLGGRHVELDLDVRAKRRPTQPPVLPWQQVGIPDARNQYVKAVSEMAWMDYYVRGRGKKFAWRDVLATLEDDATRTKGPGGTPER